MMMTMTIKGLLLLVLVMVNSALTIQQDRPTTVGEHHELMVKLFNVASDQQVKKDEKYFPGLHWMQRKGVYKSDIKLNFHGNPQYAEIRRLGNVMDNNMFATAWVTSSLLEVFRYKPSSSSFNFKPSQEQLLSALDVIHSHRNMNTKTKSAAKSGVFSFWQQHYNKTLKYWDSAPDNLLNAFHSLNELPLAAVEEILRAMGLDNIAKVIDEIKRSEPMYLQAFHIPPDFDDTFVNLGLGALLCDLKEDFQPAWKMWQANNENISSVVTALEKYAYRPFSDDPAVNAIDPRSYFYLRGFLDDAHSNGQDVSLVRTWVQNIYDLRTEFYKDVVMPFNVNNVDITVAANTIYGLTAAVLNGLLPVSELDNKELAQTYSSTSLLLSYMINHNITGRPDLALTYYPSRAEFYWFVARTTAEMDTYMTKKPLPHPVLKEAHGNLTLALKTNMTKDIISRAIREPNGRIYLDDFLGNADLTLDNKPLNRAEDRIFTTAMAANALLYTWTVRATYNMCSWKQDTPSSVKTTVKGCVDWLSANILSGDYDPWNAFFSGSVKGDTTYPYTYPANLYEHLNGTKVTDWTRFPRSEDRIAVSGYIPKKDYDEMIAAKHFGYPTPLEFHGYNNGASKSLFPLWSSDAYTYSTALITMARYDCLTV